MPQTQLLSLSPWSLWVRTAREEGPRSAANEDVRALAHRGLPAFPRPPPS